MVMTARRGTRLCKWIFALAISTSLIVNPLAISAHAASASAHTLPAPTADQLRQFVRYAKEMGKTSVKRLFRTSRIRQTTDEKVTAKKIDDKVKSGLAAKPAEFAKETGRSLVMILSVVALDMMRREIHRKNVAAEKLDFAELLEFSFTACTQLLDHGEFWAGFAGAGVVGSAASKAVSELRGMLGSAASRSLFARLLQANVLTLVTFFGWEFSAQAWEEARLLLEDDKDFERAGHLFSVGWGALSSLTDSTTASDEDDRRILGLMGQNLLRVLIFDDELRAEWFYNTKRLRLNNGKFAALVATFMASASAGATGGPLIGAIFGVVGVVSYVFLPEPIVDAITDFMKSNRVTNRRVELLQNYHDLELIMARIKQLDLFPGKAGRLRELNKELAKRMKVRDDLVTVHFERIYLLRKRIEDSQREIAEAQTAPPSPPPATSPLITNEPFMAYMSGDSNPPQAPVLSYAQRTIVDKTNIVHSSESALEKIYVSLSSIYIDEGKRLQKLQRLIAPNDAEVSEIIDRERNAIDRLDGFIRSFLYGLTRDEKTSLQVLEGNYFRGFFEAKTLKFYENR